MTTTAEIVTFRCTAGTSAEALTTAARGMEPFLIAQGGMMHRTLSVDDNGLWTDHILWVSQEAAQSAAAAVMQAPEAAPFMALIDADTVSMRHARVAMQQE